MTESKIEERLARLETLLEQFLEVEGRELEKMLEDKVSQAIAEATSTSNNLTWLTLSSSNFSNSLPFNSRNCSINVSNRASLSSILESVIVCNLKFSSILVVPVLSIILLLKERAD